MRLKTFLATYMLFVLIFFTSLGVVSVHMTNSQFGMLREKSAAEFKTIAASLAKDIAVLSGRNIDYLTFENSVRGLVDSYELYYRANNITLDIENMPDTEEIQTELSFIKQGQSHFVNISGALSGPFQHYRLNYLSDITQSVSELSRIQNTLLLLAVVCSTITAFVLYIILSKIFMPLGVVSRISRKIADGQYDERIAVKGNNELASMAENFNRMAAEIEKQIHLLEEEAAQKQRFVDNLAHEIRTPLTSIYGYAEYMLKARMDEGALIESAQSILNEAGYMRKISDSLLELARLDNNSVRKQRIALPRLLDDAAQSLRGIMPDKRVQIVLACEAEAVLGQEELLRSMLMNLGVNALKACPAVGGIIRLEAKEDAERVILSVEDNGCGIPKESIEKVAEPFYRVDKARSRETGGAGLGLALCQTIASVHGAQMRIESEPGLGTKIEVIFTTS